MNIKDIKRVAIIGSAGTMGEGIVQTFATAGFNVRALGRNPDKLSASLKQIEANMRLFSNNWLYTTRNKH